MSEEIKDTNASDSAIDRQDDHDSGRQESLRASIEKAWETHAGHKPESRGDQDDQYEQDRREERRAEPKGRAARAAKDAAGADAKSRDAASRTDSVDGAAGAAAGGLDISEAPKSWRADEKAVWPQVPEKARAAFHRREQEGQRGVDDLKRNYAELDAALAPHLPTIKSFGHSSAQAVTQLFAWQNALSNDPKRFFPELMKNYGVGPLDIFPELAAGGGYAQQQQDASQQQQQFDPRHVQQIIDARLQPIYAAAQQVQAQQKQQQAAQTQQIVTNFSRGKKHFENVRVKMAQLIQAGVAGLNEDGSINLDHAYETALHLDPGIWAQVQKENEAQARAARNAEADRKRYASSSLSPTSPGSNNSIGAGKKRRGLSVRDSINAAMDEVSGR